MKNLIITGVLVVGVVAGGVLAMQAMVQPKPHCAHCVVKKSTCCPKMTGEKGHAGHDDIPAG